MDKGIPAKNDKGLSGNRGRFSGRLGYVLSVAGSAVGLGNIWRFPYLAAKYGGGMFLLVYLVLMVTFGYVLIVSETALGRMTGKSPVGAFRSFGKSLPFHLGGWINALVPMLIVPYYCVIGGWVLKYLAEYLRGNGNILAGDSYFPDFISSFTFRIFCYISGSEARGRTGFQADDAYIGSTCYFYNGILGDQAGGSGRCKIFFGARF